MNITHERDVLIKIRHIHVLDSVRALFENAWYFVTDALTFSRSKTFLLCSPGKFLQKPSVPVGSVFALFLEFRCRRRERRNRSARHIQPLHPALIIFKKKVSKGVHCDNLALFRHQPFPLRSEEHTSELQ